MSQERRKFMRLSSPGMECRVEMGGYQATGTILDESIGGLRIGDLSLLTTLVNQPVVITYDGETVHGTCRSIARQPSSLFQMGVRRSDAGSKFDNDKQEPSQAMLSNTFMEFGGVDLVCVPVASVDDSKITVMLIDGKRFAVGREKLFALTRQERIERLSNLKHFRSVLEVYGLEDTDNQFTACDQIVDHEFGPAIELAPVAQAVGR